MNFVISEKYVESTLQMQSLFKWKRMLSTW